MNMTMPIENYSDFITFINRSNLNDISTIVRDEIICNAIYAIWTTYDDRMQIMHYNPMDLAEFLASYHSKLIAKFNIYNKAAMLMLPYHLRAISNKEHFDHGHQDNNEGPKHTLVRYAICQPSVKPITNNYLYSDNLIHRPWRMNRGQAHLTSSAHARTLNAH